MSIRTDLIELLAAKLPNTYQIAGPLSIPDRITRRTVLVWVEAVRPHNIELTGLRLDVTVWVLTPKEGPAADADLDECLLDMIAAVRSLPAVAWASATRGVFAEKHHGYQFELVSAASITTPTETPEEPEE